MKQILITAAFLIFNISFLKAQIAINTDNSNPDSSAILDIKSTNKGFLYPRMSTAERDAISKPSIGLTIFNLDDKCTDIYDGNTWMKDCPLVLVPDSLISPPWTQKADLDGMARQDAVGFSINGKGYIGTGWDETGPIKDFWEYDPTTDTWTQKADFGGIVREDAVGFSINGKGYIGIGFDGSSMIKDFWEYDPTTDTWTQKADFGGTAREDAVGFSINGKGYIGTGWDETGPIKDFWEYDPTTDTWTQKTDFSGTARFRAVGFSINDKGYIGTGLYINRIKDFWEYDLSPTYQSSQPAMGFVSNSVLNDRDNDTKIQVEENPDEDIIRFDIEGREAVNMNSDFPLNIIATPSNRDLLRLFTTADTAVWNLRLQGTSNKDLGFTETSVADNRFVLAAGGNVGIGTASPSTTLDVNGSVTATAFSGDGSNLSNVPGDNLGNHTATTTLNLGNNNITNAGSITATAFLGDGSNLTNLPIATTLQDTDADTKIQVEESNDENVIRFDIAGREAVNMDNDFPINIIATPNNRHLLRLFTTADTAAWHLRLQGTSNKDLGFTETGEADHRLVLQAGGNIGIGIENPNVALDVNGDIEYTGTITDVSDRRLKENLLPISSVLSKLLQLQAYSYHMKDDEEKTREYGLLAQEVQKVFPELVSNIDAEGKYLGLSYIQLIPILIEGMKELKLENEELKIENTEWASQVEELKAKEELHQVRNIDFETRLSQLETLLSQKETKQTNSSNSEK